MHAELRDLKLEVARLRDQLERCDSRHDRARYGFGVLAALAVLCQLGVHVPALVWQSIGVPAVTSAAAAPGHTTGAQLHGADAGGAKASKGEPRVFNPEGD